MRVKKAIATGLAAGVIAVPVASIVPSSAIAAPATTASTAFAVAHVIPLPTRGTGSATFTLTRFVHRSGVNYAEGVVRVVNASTHQSATRNVALALRPSAQHSAVRNAPATTCTILDLTLGPLHLDLLGLVIDLNQVHLVITAQTGPGKLLGNLLCALANLLNPSGSGLVVDLNRWLVPAAA